LKIRLLFFTKQIESKPVTLVCCMLFEYSSSACEEGRRAETSNTGRVHVSHHLLADCWRVQRRTRYSPELPLILVI